MNSQSPAHRIRANNISPDRKVAVPHFVKMLGPEWSFIQAQGGDASRQDDQPFVHPFCQDAGNQRNGSRTISCDTWLCQLYANLGVNHP
jgi:hypothetical protein